jgi:serine/threonine protein kinase
VEKQIADRHPKGTIINERYEIIKYVAEGGQKRVYEVKDLNMEIINKPIVLKEMKRSTQQDMDLAGMQLFEQESIILKSLSHPSLPKIFDFFIAQGTFYIIQEYIEGDTLDRYLAKGFMPEIKALDFSVQMAEFLDYLHSKKPAIIYRDLKPANVIVNNDSRLFICDLSGARLPGIGKYAEMVKVKTAGYFPSDTAHAGTDTDVYALGIVLYEMLTRYNVSKSNGKLPPIRELRETISPEVEMILNKSVFYNRLFRIRTAWEIRIELDEALRSLRKSAPIMDGTRKGPFASLYLFLHNCYLRSVKAMGPLMLLFLILGVPALPFLTHFFSEGKENVYKYLEPRTLYAFCPIALVVYLIWVRTMAYNSALAKMYQLFHQRIKLLGGFRFITILVTVNFITIIALYIIILLSMLGFIK